MDIFNSQWLINMLAKSSTTPQGRLLNLFDILDDWLNAPNINIVISKDPTHNSQLIAFCTDQAKSCGAANPTILAEHIVLIARNAACQEINNPGSASLAHAKKAAHALILAQTQKELVIPKFALYGIAASLFVMITAAALLLPNLINNNHSPITLSKINSENPKVALVVSRQASKKLTAQDAATMYSKYEQMRNGTCQFPEVIQIPDKDKAIYLENVVGGKLPTDLGDLAIANSYLEKVRCNFTPMLMANSK